MRPRLMQLYLHSTAADGDDDEVRFSFVFILFHLVEKSILKTYLNWAYTLRRTLYIL